MSIFIGGCIALLLGIVGIIIWWWNFLAILQGVVPIMLIFAGALAVYLSYDQFKAKLDARKDNSTIDVETSPVAATGDVEALKKENEELKRKLDEQNQKIDDAIKTEPAAKTEEPKTEEAVVTETVKVEEKIKTTAKDKAEKQDA